MTGPEHYRAAEALITTGNYDGPEPEIMPQDIALAQVHATLALAAATAATAVELGHDTDDWTAALREGAP